MTHFLWIVFSSIPLLLALPGISVGMAPPNVLIFLMDDMGIGDCRAYNASSKVEMPNLEKWHAKGFVLLMPTLQPQCVPQPVTVL